MDTSRRGYCVFDMKCMMLNLACLLDNDCSTMDDLPFIHRIIYDTGPCLMIEYEFGTWMTYRSLGIVHITCISNRNIINLQ